MYNVVILLILIASEVCRSVNNIAVMQQVKMTFSLQVIRENFTRAANINAFSVFPGLEEGGRCIFWQTHI